MARALIIEESVSIARNADAVWAMVTDYSSDHLWRPGITEMTPDPPGPPAVGTRVREVLQSGKRGFVTQSTVTAVGPGMTYRFSGTGTTGKVEGSRTVEAIDARHRDVHVQGGAHARRELPVHAPTRRHDDAEGPARRPRPAPGAARTIRRGLLVTTLDDVTRLLALDHGLCVVSTARADGTVQSSLVNAGCSRIRHRLPRCSGSSRVDEPASSSTSAPGRSSPRSPGPAGTGLQSKATPELIGPDDPVAGIDADGLRLLLRDLQRSGRDARRLGGVRPRHGRRAPHRRTGHAATRVLERLTGADRRGDPVPQGHARRARAVPALARLPARRGHPKGRGTERGAVRGGRPTAR